MDDVDAVNAQIARNMLDSGDWVTARIDGVKYLEKSPLGFWLMASSYAVFGVHDWAARLPTALGAIALMFVTAALGSWGFGRRAGFYAGLAVGTSAGLFLFTRIVIPDVLLTLSITCSFYCFVKALDEGPENRRWWAWGFWAFIGVGMLLKGLLAALVPVATGTLYLLLTRRFFARGSWRRLRPLTGIPLAILIYAPWVALATLRNPPFFDFTFHSDPGVYRGFFWFYFINEHILRFLNLRYPRDYNTVPRIPFLLLHLVWIFPWSVFLPVALHGWRPFGEDRSSRLRVLAVIWIVFLLTFLSFSTTQEYYSMPCYPAFALLAGAALAGGARRWIAAGYGMLAALGCAAAAAAGVILYLVRGMTPVGDISNALSRNPSEYTLSLGHMLDLTLASFAYLRAPLALAGLALGAGALAAWFTRRSAVAPLCLAAMMALFLQAAHRAMGIFDPYLSSRPLADTLERSPGGQLVIEGHYYPASSVVFYTDQKALLLNGRQENLAYGSVAPGAPPVFLEDTGLAQRWKGERRLYLVAPESSRPRFQSLLGAIYVVAERGGKCLLSNQPVRADAPGFH
ncbi:MAG TPA: glycosyltransferase family 39 protein [Bryobacterales bacterium]|nr:glycosyltransferase family 39 protein [Bryobacterales bacterium]